MVRVTAAALAYAALIIGQAAADLPKVCYLKDGMPNKDKTQCDGALNDFTKCQKLAAVGICVWGPCYPGQHPAGICPPAPAPGPGPSPTPPAPTPTPPTPTPTPPNATACHLKPGAPVSYEPFCTACTSRAMCVAANMTCAWGAPNTTHGTCQLKPGQPAAYRSLCAAQKTLAACNDLNRTCAWSTVPAPPTPPAPPGPTPTPPPPPPPGPSGLKCSCKPTCQGGDGPGNKCSDDNCICSQCRALLAKATTLGSACDYARTSVATCQACLIRHITDVWGTCTGPFDGTDDTVKRPFCHYNNICGLHDITHFCREPPLAPPPPPPPTNGSCVLRDGQPTVYAEMCTFARASGPPADPLGDPPATFADCASWMYSETCVWQNNGTDI
jgi:hypothetical protein